MRAAVRCSKGIKTWVPKSTEHLSPRKENANLRVKHTLGLLIFVSYGILLKIMFKDMPGEMHHGRWAVECPRGLAKQGLVHQGSQYGQGTIKEVDKGAIKEAPFGVCSLGGRVP